MCIDEWSPKQSSSSAKQSKVPTLCPYHTREHLALKVYCKEKQKKKLAIRSFVFQPVKMTKSSKEWLWRRGGAVVGYVVLILRLYLLQKCWDDGFTRFLPPNFGRVEGPTLIFPVNHMSWTPLILPMKIHF